MSKYIDADRIRRGVTDNMLEAEYLENHKDNAIAAHFRGQALAYATVLDGLDKLEQEQTEVDITMEIDKNVMRLRTVPTYDELVRFARYFFELGQRKAAEMYDEIEYNRQRAQEQEGQR